MGGSQSSQGNGGSGGSTPVTHLGTRKSMQRKLEEEYFIQKVQLGTGSFGVVRRAIHKPTQEDRAVKSIDKRRVEMKPNYRQHLQREIEIMRECFGHSNIVKLYDWFEDEQNIHLVLEYCGGGDFGDRILQCRATMTEAHACDWFHQILLAVDVLHSKGVCHRDVKPENFLISSVNAQKVILKLSDFGLAIRVATPLRELAGTPAYQAPEIHNLNNLPASTGTDFSSSGYGLPVDLWACGVTLFVILSGGKNPYVNSQTNKLLLNDIRSGTIRFDELMITYPEGSDSGTKTSKSRGGLFSSSSTAAAAAGRTKPHASSNAEQLLRLLLTVDPTRRLTVGDALRHPWFVQNGMASPPPSSPVSIGGNALVSAVLRSPGSIDSGSLEASPPTMEPILIAPSRRANSFELHIEEDSPLAIRRRESGVPASAVTIGPGGSKDGKVVRCTKCGSFFYSQRGQASACPECRVQLGFTLPADSVGAGCVVYHSVGGKWVRGTMARFIDQTGEFELDNGLRVGGTAVAPPGKDVGPGPAWPKGTSVVYQSATYGTWLPATIEGFSSTTRTYDLDVKNGVPADRIRARVKRLTQ